MKVRMKKTACGSEDGRFTQEYVEGNTYEVGDRLGAIFLDMGAAEKVEGKAAPEPEAKGKGKK